MVDWSIVMGIAIGLGLPTMTGLFMIVRMENRVTHLETSRTSDQQWLTSITEKLDAIARDLNQLIGAQNAKDKQGD